MQTKAVVVLPENTVLQLVLLGGECGVYWCLCVLLQLEFNLFAEGYLLGLSNANIRTSATIERLLRETSAQLRSTVIFFRPLGLLCEYSIPQVR